ncbi:hypothetical protein D1007_06517 [Hordeum vulgare]|nr:hypothetical protein D1007_06517 [Hordeum vulgare]
MSTLLHLFTFLDVISANMIEKERQACELMREELVEVKKKSGEAEAACVVEYQLLLKRAEAIDARAEANDARFSRLMDLFKGKIA